MRSIVRLTWFALPAAGRPDEAGRSRYECPRFRRHQAWKSPGNDCYGLGAGGARAGGDQSVGCRGIPGGRPAEPWLITGNLKHFPEPIRDGVTVVSPADFLIHVVVGIKKP